MSAAYSPYSAVPMPLGPRRREAETVKNELGTINGCFVPCLLTILGATLFLRLGFAVGAMGLAGAAGVLLFSVMLCLITISSFSAICSNGNNGAGGAYYMISRSLGLRYGAASGFLFWLSYSLNAAYNTAAFTSMVQATFFAGTWYGSGYGSTIMISTITLIPLTAVAWHGAGTFARVNFFVFVGLAVACVMVPYGLFAKGDHTPLEGGKLGFVGPFTEENLMTNMWPETVWNTSICHGKCGLEHIFALLFPAVVGMMEGLNLIGDLEDPIRSIPTGTYSAVIGSFVVYMTMLVAQSGTISRIALQQDPNILQHASLAHGKFVVLGVMTACLSTVLGSMFGASRILQAMARDEVFPKMGFLKKGTAQGDEPQNAVIISYYCSQVAVFFGDINAIAPLLTISFLLTYSLTDFSCFLLETRHSGGFFKPTFRFYSWQTSLFNSAVVLFVMFYLNVPQALAAIGIGIVAFITARDESGESLFDSFITKYVDTNNKETRHLLNRHAERTEDSILKNCEPEMEPQDA